VHNFAYTHLLASLSGHGGDVLLQVGKDPVHVRVELEVDWMPMRYLLPPALADALQLQYETRSRITAALWTYIVEKRLQASSWVF
jgi:hypothetical protein